MALVSITDDSSKRGKSLNLKPPVFQEFILIPSTGECMFLTQDETNALFEKTDKLDKAIIAFYDAKNSGDPLKAETESENLNKALIMVGQEKEEEEADKAVKESKEPLVIMKGDGSLTEILAFGKQKIIFAPTKLVSKYKKTEGRRTNVFKFKKKDTKEEREEVKEYDAFSTWRNEKGELDKKKIKEAFKEVKKDVAVKWNFVKDAEKTGQIPYYIINSISSPAIASFLRDEDFTTIDKWVEKFNENANTSYNKKSDDRKKIIDLLKKDNDFSPDDADKVLRGIKDIWGKKNLDDEATSYTKFADSIALEYSSEIILKYKSKREELANKVENQELPPVRWDASAQAQLLRYSFGATCKGEFDLIKGKVSANAEAHADIALAEGKAEISGYIPNDKGAQLKFNIKVRKEVYEWRQEDISNENESLFFYNNSFFQVSAVYGTFRNIATINAVKNAYPNGAVMLTMTGYTDETGPGSYNQKLSEYRAIAAYGFLQKDVGAWMQFFEKGIWGDEEIQYMQTALYMFNRDPMLFDAWFLVHEPKETLVEFNAMTIDYHSDFFEKLNDYQKQELFKGSYYKKRVAQLSKDRVLSGMERIQSLSTNSQETELNLRALIAAYFETVSNYCRDLEGVKVSLDKIFCFHKTYVAGMGENKILPGTFGRDVRNRRITLDCYVIDETRSGIKLEDDEVDLGYIRLFFNGFVSAWAGANISVAASLEVDCPQGMLMITGKKDKKDKKEEGNKTDKKKKEEEEGVGELDVEASAFAGAKAEAGVKAELDWKEPAQPAVTEEAGEFKTLGSVGYTVTGMAGAGIEGEFKIGFDRRSGRFQIKFKAKAALGLGLGGEFSFSVGVNDLWHFIKLVHSELLSKNFSFIDTFEGIQSESGIDVFALFNAWSVALLCKGNIIGAGLVYGHGKALEQAIELLKDADELIRDWEMRSQSVDDLNELVKSLKKQPEIISRLTPETKGRMLYLLTQHRTNLLDDFFKNGKIFDRNHDYEEAALAIIEKGMNSLRDWQETLEHMAQYDKASGKYYPYINEEMASGIKTQKEMADGALRMKQNETWLKSNLLYDADDWERVVKKINLLQ